MKTYLREREDKWTFRIKRVLKIIDSFLFSKTVAYPPYFLPAFGTTIIEIHYSVSPRSIGDIALRLA